MADLLAHPFRLTPSGAAVTRPQDSPAHNAEQLGLLILTRPGERDLVPDLGVPDPTFSSPFGRGLLQEQVDAFGPPLLIKQVGARFTSDTRVTVAVTFE